MFKKVRILMVVATAIAMVGIATYFFKSKVQSNKLTPSKTSALQVIWPDTNKLTNSSQDKLIKYGRDLVINTSYYLGPKGVIAHQSNGMNCQNCHLNAGRKLFGNNFSMVANSYPKYRERSGLVETITKKVEDCFERSLNGKTIDSNGTEMKAIVAYLKWIGKNAPKKVKIKTSGTEELPFLNRAADTVKGQVVYMARCSRCHGKNGAGVLNLTGTAYKYPPLWGRYSYNTGASIYRISKFAGFVKNNMPLGAEYKKSQLTNDEAWDVAAFVNSQYHPYKNFSRDWPKLATKPYDCPEGPYADHLFTQNQHKYGPYTPIKQYYLLLNKSGSQKK